MGLIILILLLVVIGITIPFAIIDTLNYVEKAVNHLKDYNE